MPGSEQQKALERTRGPRQYNNDFRQELLRIGAVDKGTEAWKCRSFDSLALRAWSLSVAYQAVAYLEING
jgi:hypothetical protein